MWRGLHGLGAGADLPAEVAALGGIELDRLIARETGKAVPAGIEALEGAERRFSTVVEATCEGIEASVEAWLAARG